ncbi:MAG: C4-dicarboxylate transporter DctA, partial [Polaromonas sp.]
LVGNGVATLVVAKWTGDLDMQRLNTALNNPNAIEAQEPEVLMDLQVTHMGLGKSQA